MNNNNHRKEIVNKLQHYARQIETGTFKLHRTTEEDVPMTHLSLELTTEGVPTTPHAVPTGTVLGAHFHEQYVYLSGTDWPEDKGVIAELFFRLGCKYVTPTYVPGHGDFITVVVYSHQPSYAAIIHTKAMYPKARTLVLSDIVDALGSAYATHIQEIKDELANTTK